MVRKVDVRIKLPADVATPWTRAAYARGLNLTSFITAVVSAELVRTGELSVPKHGDGDV